MAELTNQRSSNWSTLEVNETVADDLICRAFHRDGTDFHLTCVQNAEGTTAINSFATSTFRTTSPIHIDFISIRVRVFHCYGM